MVRLFSDEELTVLVNSNILFEGYTYYLDIEGYSKGLIDKWLYDEYMYPSIKNYHPKNKVLSIRFDNTVGFVNILGLKFDVRSRKLYDTISGNCQFQTLLDEIVKISNSLTFNFKGTSYATRKSDYKYNWNDLEVFDYYYQLVFTYNSADNLQSLLNQCIGAPNTSNIQKIERLSAGKSKRISAVFYTRLAQVSDFAEIHENHSLVNSALSKWTLKKINKRLLPLHVPNVLFQQSTNTVENRFVRFFLEEISSVSLKIINSAFDNEIKNKAYRLHDRIRLFLLDPFFEGIQRLTYIPNSSSVLIKRAGYKEIYSHFIQSKSSFRPLLEESKKDAHRSGLKNIATLYEIWVFFKIAQELFNDKIITETFNGQLLKNGSMVSSYSWENGDYQLFFNKSYTYGNKGSYSVTLRPDVSLELRGKLFLFDAKYKFNDKSSESDELLRIVTPEDIHKMHSYLDAIPKAVSAIVVYPGNQFIFYSKENGKITEVNMSKTFAGVGAVPLSPNLSNDKLKYLLQNL